MFEPHAATVLALLEARQLSAAVVPDPRTAAGVVWAGGNADAERDRVLQAIAEHLALTWVRDLPPQVSAAVVALLDPALARDLGIMPIAVNADGGVEVAVVNPFDQRIPREVAGALGCPVVCRVADPPGVLSLIRRHYGSEGDRVGPAGSLAVEDARDRAVPVPVVRAVDDLLGAAVRERASDLHLEVFDGTFQVRMRVDGTFVRLEPPPLSLAGPMLSRIKVLAGLDIAETRRPQDGRIRVLSAGRPVDLRVSTLPTHGGESVVVRVLDAPAQGRRLADLGLSPAALEGIERVLARPQGLLAVTGPTGSGKTTTLYGVLDRLNTPGRKLITVEDPVEYEVEGITQIALAPAVGLTFAAAVRAFLRHDPDVIMVGEIRDEATARVAVQAALTGHLVLTTLHAGDSVGVIARLLDMGIEPYLIAAALQGVVAQRLVPRICPQCREPVATEPGAAGGPGLATLAPGYRGRGCAQCEQRGSRGRVGLYEWLEVDDALREAIAEQRPPSALRAAARAAGLTALEDDAARLVRLGLASLEDVRRVR
jgi:type IV pilus assembly protein PilB